MEVLIVLIMLFAPLVAYYYWLLFRKEKGEPTEYLGQYWEVSAQAFSEKHGGSGFYLRFIMNFPHHNVHLDFHRESSWSEMLKDLSIAHECQTGDRNFDDLVYINTDSRTIHNLLKSEGSIRALIQKLLSNDEIKKIQIKNGKISIHIKTYRTEFTRKQSLMQIFHKEDLAGFLQDFGETSSNLIDLKNQLLEKWGTDPINWDRLGFQQGLKLTLASVALTGAGLALYYLVYFSGRFGQIHDDISFFGYGLAPALALFLVFMIAGLMWMKGSAWAPHFLFPFLFLMVVAAPACSYAVFKYLNHQVSSPEQLLSVDILLHQIQERKSRYSSHKACYTVSIHPIRSYQTQAFDLDLFACETLDRMKARGEKPQFQYDMHKGLFGFHWYTKRKLISTRN